MPQVGCRGRGGVSAEVVGRCVRRRGVKGDARRLRPKAAQRPSRSAMTPPQARCHCLGTMKNRADPLGCIREDVQDLLAS
jgi:hypothetical protein